MIPNYEPFDIDNGPDKFSHRILVYRDLPVSTLMRSMPD